ncbi:MAG TPA: glycosyltransferase [Bryobacteraceae bacterium]|jgi:GT2 family glycosyltransferase|nr:glycosyltransferase [Bryobacteraceae bacterium]
MAENLPVEEPLGPRVSAILVGWNQVEPLRRAVAALERSIDRERLEILVVDLGSQDGSAQLDSEFPAIVILRLPHNFGATKAMNIGTRTAKADLVFYLSPDVEVAPDTVSKLADKLEGDSDAAAVCPLLVDEEGKPASRVYKLPVKESFKGEMPTVPIDVNRESVNVEYPGRDAVLVRKQFVKGMNYFDERYGEYWADADLAMQIRRGLKKIRLYPSISAVKHADTSPDAAKGLLAADRAGGAAAFIGKYHGFMAGLGFRIGAIFRALGHFDFKQLVALASGQKIDGSQGG